MKSGFEVIAELTGLKETLEREKVDIVITGEGKIDSQTEDGKLITRLLKHTQRKGIPTIAIAGHLAQSQKSLPNVGLTDAFCLINRPMSEAEAMSSAPQLLEDQLTNLVRTIGWEK